MLRGSTSPSTWSAGGETKQDVVGLFRGVGRVARVHMVRSAFPALQHITGDVVLCRAGDWAKEVRVDDSAARRGVHTVCPVHAVCSGSGDAESVQWAGQKHKGQLSIASLAYVILSVVAKFALGVSYICFVRLFPFSSKG